MRTPSDGARPSSGFGMRKHPILGYSRMHKGTDFAAPSGTPIYAAGNGVVDYAGRNGGYGKYVRLRHGSTYQTAYAHMKSIAKGIAKGARVKQGQRSEEHTSELQSLMRISYAVFCLTKKNEINNCNT